MFSGADDGVEISDGKSGIRLRRAGPNNAIGVPTVIDVIAGPFSGNIEDGTVGSYQTFISQLLAFLENSSSKAKLSSYSGFVLDLESCDNGKILVSVKIVVQQDPPIRLSFGFTIDRAILPEIRDGFEKHFVDSLQEGTQ